MNFGNYVLGEFVGVVVVVVSCVFVVVIESVWGDFWIECFVELSVYGV